MGVFLQVKSDRVER